MNQGFTFESRDHSDPVMTPDGRVFFVAHDDLGANIYEAMETGLVRRSRIATGLHYLGPGPDGVVVGGHHHRLPGDVELLSAEHMGHRLATVAAGTAALRAA